MGQMKAKLDEELKKVEMKAQEERSELRQTLTLDYEVELDICKQQLVAGENDRLEGLLSEVTELKKTIKEREDECTDLRTKSQLQDVTCDEKIKEEKEKIVQILEAGFVQRQKLALEQLETSLSEAHRTELQTLTTTKNEEMHTRLEEMRQKLV